MSRSETHIPPRKQIARAFGLKASTYQTSAVIQKEIIERLMPRIATCDLAEGLWVDLGCGTGTLERLLAAKKVPLHMVCLDIAQESLMYLKTSLPDRVSPVLADIERIPCKEHRFSGAITASVLQWFPDTTEILHSVSRLLKAHGKFIFAVFIKDSFREIAEIRAVHKIPDPVILPEPSSFINELNQSGFELVESELFVETVRFTSSLELLRNLSAVGSTAISGPRLTRKKLQEFCVDYESRFKSSSGVPLTYRALLGTAVVRNQHETE